MISSTAQPVTSSRTFIPFDTVQLASRNVPVVFPDTCSLLDVVRSPRRSNVTAADVKAIDAINVALSSSQIDSIVSEQVASEFDERYGGVVAEADKELRRLEDEVNRLVGWAV